MQRAAGDWTGFHSNLCCSRWSLRSTWLNGRWSVWQPPQLPFSCGYIFNHLINSCFSVVSLWQPICRRSRPENIFRLTSNPSPLLITELIKSDILWSTVRVYIIQILWAVQGKGGTQEWIMHLPYFWPPSQGKLLILRDRLWPTSGHLFSLILWGGSSVLPQPTHTRGG